MKQLSKRALSLLLSLAFALSSMAVASAASCGTKAMGTDSGMTMACCMQHKTTGMNAPCHCAVKSAPATAPQNIASTSAADFDTPAAEVAQPKPFVAFQNEPINSQWLALDCRLRAPPPKLYLLNCAFLE